jgi:biopolymer transport protein ExbD
MSFRRGIRNRKVRRKKNEMFELQLTSMMDALIIIVVFLLRSYSQSLHQFETVPGIQLPISISQDLPTESLQVIVTPAGMVMDGERILDFETQGDIDTDTVTYQFKPQDLDEGGRRIVPLYDALKKARERSELLRVKSREEMGAQAPDPNAPIPFDDILAIQADKRVQYDTLRKIMFTAGDSGYRVFRFLARKQDE